MNQHDTTINRQENNDAELLKHECGVTMIRLLKLLKYYQDKYGTWQYALNKLYLTMGKQHNRGQEGAGTACIKLGSEPGTEYMSRKRAEGKNTIIKIFGNVRSVFVGESPEDMTDIKYVRRKLSSVGELYMGHLRYSTMGKKGLSYVHPLVRQNNWRAKSLCLYGNSSITSAEGAFQKLIQREQCPRINSDSYLMLGFVDHRLNREVECNCVNVKSLGLEDVDIICHTEDHVQVSNVLKATIQDFDGGYVVCGTIGSGKMFSMRDPWGIRPAFYCRNDKVAALASKCPVLQTTPDLECGDTCELQPGQTLLIKRSGGCSVEQALKQRGNSPCSFEQVYLDRSSDHDIYKERGKLEEPLTPAMLKAINNDVTRTAFLFISNAMEMVFYGLLQGSRQHVHQKKIQTTQSLGRVPTAAELEDILSELVRSKKVAWKDIKLRTFITEGNSHSDLVSHVYDITYESLVAYQDNPMIIDGGIVHGTTLKESILYILDRLHPKKIVIISSVPQVHYPDYYEIDISSLRESCVFHAVIKLLKDQSKEDAIGDVYAACLEELKKPVEGIRNCIRDVYKPFTVEEISEKIIRMFRPKDVTVPIELVFQSIDGLYQAIPNHRGDWCSTGLYPTPNDMKLCNQALIGYYEKEYRQS